MPYRIYSKYGHMPSFEADVCTHKNPLDLHSAQKCHEHKDDEGWCNANMHREGCKWNRPPVMLPTTAGCSNYDDITTGVYTERAFTPEECNKKCLQHEDCAYFAIGMRPDIQGQCFTAREGCKFNSTQGLWNIYVKYGEMSSLDAHVCTHREHELKKHTIDECKSVNNMTIDDSMLPPPPTGTGAPAIDPALQKRYVR